MRSFYLSWEIFQTASGKLGAQVRSVHPVAISGDEIVQAASVQSTIIVESSACTNPFDVGQLALNVSDLAGQPIAESALASQTPPARTTDSTPACRTRPPPSGPRGSPRPRSPTRRRHGRWP